MQTFDIGATHLKGGIVTYLCCFDTGKGSKQ